MANQSIATVVTVTGQAFARNEKLELRALKPGDTLLEGETIITSANGRVELSFIDGSTMEVVPEQTIFMAADLFESGRPDVTDSALADTTTEEILQALAEGRDIDTALEAPAAGTAVEGSGLGDGNDFVRLVRIVEEVNPLAFDFDGTSQPEPPVFEDGVILDEVEPSDITTVILDNDATVTIPVGASTGTSTPFAVQGDDPYIDGERYDVAISGTSGGNFDSLDTTDTATVIINDTPDITTVTLGTVTVAEGSGSATITASVDNAVTDSDLVVTLDNGATVTIPVGASTGTSTPFAVQGDDPYIDGASYDVAISGTSGGNFEALDTTDTATVIINDTPDITTVTLGTVTVAEGSGSATITASVDNAVTDSDLVVTLDNGATVTIPVGASTGTSTPFAVQGDDPYIDGASYDVAISGTSGGNFEALDTTDTATVIINDTPDITTVTLGTVTVAEGSGSATITASVDNAVTDSDLVVTLDNGATVTIPVGASTGTSTPFAVQGDDPYIDGASYDVAISGTSGGNFEALDTTDTATVIINDTPDITTVTLGAVTVAEFNSYTIDATITNAPTVEPLVLILSNNTTVTIPVGATTGTSTTATAPNVADGDGTLSVSMDSYSGGTEFENLVSNTGIVSIIDSGATGGAVETSVLEGSAIDVTVPAGSSLDLPMTVVDNIYTGTLGTQVKVLNGVFKYDAPVRDHSDEIPDVEIFTVTVQDHDGSRAQSTVNINIINDLPTISAINLATPNLADTYQGTYNFDVGADEQLFNVSFDSTSLEWSNAPAGFAFSHNDIGSTATNQLYEATDTSGTIFFTVNVRADGVYDFQLVNPIPVTEVVVPSLLAGIDGGSKLDSYTINNSAFDGYFDLVLTGTEVDNKGYFQSSTLTISATDLGVGDNVMHGSKEETLKFDVQPTSPTANVSISELTIALSKTGGVKITDLVDLKITYTDSTFETDSQTIGSDYEGNLE